MAHKLPKTPETAGSRADGCGFFTAFPEVFRRQSRYFVLAVLIILLGGALGGLAVRYDPASIDALLPADYLRNPNLRVRQEEKGRITIWILRR